MSKKSMIKSLVYFLLLSPLCLSAYADSRQEKRLENTWVVDLITEDFVLASVNGRVVAGDRLAVRLVKNHCDNANIITWVYSYISPEKVSELNGQTISANLMGTKSQVKVLHSAPFLMGSRSTIEIGWIKLSDLDRMFAQLAAFDIEYLSVPNGKITEYFDINQNNWSLDGFSTALSKAKIICETLKH